MTDLDDLLGHAQCHSYTQEQLLAALTKVTQRQLASLFVSMAALAGMSHGNELRTALKSVFDLSAIEDYTQECMVQMTLARAEASDARALLAEVTKDFEELEKRMDAIRFELEQHELNTVRRKCAPVKGGANGQA